MIRKWKVIGEGEITGPSYTLIKETIFEYTIIDENGCEATDQVRVFVKIEYECVVAECDIAEFGSRAEQAL